MERLAERDVEALLDFLGKIYRLDNLGGFVETLLAALPLLVPAEVVAFSDMRSDPNLSKNLTNPSGLVPPILNEAFQRHINGHPVLTHNVTTGDGSAVRFADFLTQRKHRELALYNEFFRQLGIEDGLCIALAIPKPRVVGIGLHRDRWSFTERDKLVMNLVRPHLVQAWRNAKAVERLQGQIGLIRKALEMTDRGVMALDPSGRTRFATPRARSLIEEFFGGFSLRRLPEVLECWLRRQQALLGSKEVAPALTPLEIVREGKRLLGRLIPDDGINWLLLDEKITEIRSASLTRLGLTRRESEILVWVAQGKTNGEIASILGVSPRTVHKHMEHIFVKFGVETRTAAARVAFRAILG